MIQELWDKIRALYQAGNLAESERVCRQLLDLGAKLDTVRGQFMDTALAHLGGALGIPVWVLLPQRAGAPAKRAFSWRPPLAS